jgi:hypothetical protein
MRSGCVLTETKIEGSSLRFCVFRPGFFGFETLPGRPVKRQSLVSWPGAMLFRVAAVLLRADVVGPRLLICFSRLIVSPHSFWVLRRGKEQGRALGVRTTLILYSIIVITRQWYLGGGGDGRGLVASMAGLSSGGMMEKRQRLPWNGPGGGAAIWDWILWLHGPAKDRPLRGRRLLHC